MHILLASNRAPQPWRNGGGVTFPVAAEPDDAGAGSEFDWRVSIAEIVEDGAFSIFPFVDRQITILDGVGVDLDIDGAVVQLRTGVVVPFRGESSVVAKLVDGPTVDLNLMTRRGRAVGSIRTQRVSSAGLAVGGGAAVTILLVVTGSVSCGDISLNALDAIRLDPDDGLFDAAGNARVAIIEIRPAPIHG